MLKPTLVILSAALLGGCAAEAGDEAPPPSHPASPQAAEGRPHAASGVLGISTADPARHVRHQDRPATAPAATPSDAYTCPHHPEVVSDEPGECPKCHMKLRKKAAAQEHSHGH